MPHPNNTVAMLPVTTTAAVLVLVALMVFCYTMHAYLDIIKDF
jgi:hypothetical protein